MSEAKQVSAYDQMLKDAYEWWEYRISKTENDRLIKKYYPNEKTGYPRFFMDTDKLRIYCLENKIEPPAAQPTGEQREVYEAVSVEKELPHISTYYNCIVVPTRFNLNNTANVFFNADTKTWSISPNDRFIKVSHWLKRTTIGSNEAEHKAQIETLVECNNEWAERALKAELQLAQAREEIAQLEEKEKQMWKAFGDFCNAINQQQNKK